MKKVMLGPFSDGVYGLPHHIRKIVTDGANTTITDYISGIHYVDGQIEFAQTAEGRIVRDVATSTYNYEYNLTDHLGNVRVVFDPNGDTVQTSDYYPFGMLWTHQPTGLTPTNNYLYNGKELQTDLGLDWADYGARMYDPALGRWHVVDPLADKYYAFSPYNYVANNPLKNIDPDGKRIRGLKGFDAEGNPIYRRNASDDVKRVVDALMLTEIGSNGVHFLHDREAYIEFRISDEKGRDENGNSFYAESDTDNDFIELTDRNDYEDIAITIYLGDFEEDTKRQDLPISGLTEEEWIGWNAMHEISHNDIRNNQYLLDENRRNLGESLSSPYFREKREEIRTRYNLAKEKAEFYPNIQGSIYLFELRLQIQYNE